MTTQDLLATAIDGYRRQRWTKPPTTTKGRFAQTYLRVIARKVKTLPCDHPLVEAATPCTPDGTIRLGPKATNVLDDLVPGEMVASDFLDTLATAIKEDLTAEAAPIGTGGSR